ncbi:hypothetical protein [Prevotella intermedia]|nr:hypothetical protein [Prevotella intermedia]
MFCQNFSCVVLLKFLPDKTVDEVWACWGMAVWEGGSGQAGM